MRSTPAFRPRLGRDVPLDAVWQESSAPVGRRAVNRCRLSGGIPQFSELFGPAGFRLGHEKKGYRFACEIPGFNFETVVSGSWNCLRAESLNTVERWNVDWPAFESLHRLLGEPPSKW